MNFDNIILDYERELHLTDGSTIDLAPGTVIEYDTTFPSSPPQMKLEILGTPGAASSCNGTVQLRVRFTHESEPGEEFTTTIEIIQRCIDSDTIRNIRKIR